MATLETETREVRAEAKYVRAAPRKAQLVVSEIRGLPVAQAKTMLAFMTRAAARDVERVLASAVANAEANHDLVADDLYVSAAYVGAGPTLKRWRPRARGRVNRIKKRTCHITIRVAPVEGAVEARAVKKAATTAAEAKPKRPRKATPEAAAAASTAAPEVEETPVEETAAAEETPAEVEPEAEATVETEAPAEEAPVEEAPKPKRTRKPKAAPAEAPEAEAQAEAPAEAEEKPKRATRSRKKVEEPAADEAAGPEGEES
jgi:large subunit ribosomal protein L22